MQRLTMGLRLADGALAGAVGPARLPSEEPADGGEAAALLAEGGAGDGEPGRAEVAALVEVLLGDAVEALLDGDDADLREGGWIEGAEAAMRGGGG